MKIKGNKGQVQLRPMVCKGPFDMSKEFTLLHGAIEKDKKLIPEDVKSRAQSNRTILIGSPMRRRHEGVIGKLTVQFEDKEFRHAYALSLMNTYIAAQIKMLREQRHLTQQALADLIGTKQSGIARLENVNYDAWKVETLENLPKRLTFV